MFNWSRLAAVIHLPVSPTKCHVSLVGWEHRPGAECPADGFSHVLPQLTGTVACRSPPRHPHFISGKPHKVTLTRPAHWDDGLRDGHSLSFPRAGTGDPLLSSDNGYPGHNPLPNCTLFGPLSLEECFTPCRILLSSCRAASCPGSSPSQRTQRIEHPVTLTLFQHIYLISLSRNVFGLV